MLVKFKNLKTGETKEVKTGFSWVLFLFSGFFGVPLFMRKLNVLGIIFCSLLVIRILLGIGDWKAIPGLVVLAVIILPTIFCLQLWVGAKGNEMTAKNYLRNGLIFVDPESDIVRLAKIEWNIAI
jgi:hypothetical protein